MSIASLVVIADWQSIPEDHCTQYSLFHHPDLVEQYSNELEDSGAVSTVQARVPMFVQHAHSYKWVINVNGRFEYVDESVQVPIAHHMMNNDSVQVQVLQVVTSSVYHIAANNCESVNNSKYGCHWIPYSLITKKHCNDCQPICRSIYRTLNFIQFCIGAALLVISTQIVGGSAVAVISASVDKISQV